MSNNETSMGSIHSVFHRKRTVKIVNTFVKWNTVNGKQV